MDFDFPKTMSLDGGINQYIALNRLNDNSQERYGKDISPKGRKVVFLNRNGYESERQRAAELFKEGEVLTVHEIYVGRSRSTVEFEEYPNMTFNTVMFADCE